MRTGALAVLAIVIAGAAGDLAQAPARRDRAVRPPAMAGKFYPADAARLRAAVEAFMRDALPARTAEPVAIVAPHAGYVFSGQIGADAYRQIAALPIDTVVILGTDHTSGRFPGVSVYDGAGYRTPLGVAAVDRELAEALVKDGGGVFDSGLHEAEHSVEVQVPFVQVVFPKAKIVPVVVGTLDNRQTSRFGRALAGLTKGRRVVMVASSDLSHYPPQREADAVDRRTLASIAGLDAAGLLDPQRMEPTAAGPGLATNACGLAPLRVLIEAVRALGATRGTVVSYANSGDTVMGEAASVVGYGAVVFGSGDGGADTTALKTEAPDSTGPLDTEDKRVLLRLARETITRYLTTDTLPLPRGGSAKLRREAGTFVTLRRHGELRGCIGRLQPEGPLVRLVSAMALESAFKDPRFPAVTAGEVKGLEIEVSVLTPMTPVSGPDAIVVGRDGVLLRVGGRSAVFLPQVAAEQRWTRSEMLDNLAMKAGLPAGAWRDKAAKFQVFQADVFGEAGVK